MRYTVRHSTCLGGTIGRLGLLQGQGLGSAERTQQRDGEDPLIDLEQVAEVVGSQGPHPIGDVPVRFYFRRPPGFGTWCTVSCTTLSQARMCVEVLEKGMREKPETKTPLKTLLADWGACLPYQILRNVCASAQACLFGESSYRVITSCQGFRVA